MAGIIQNYKNYRTAKKAQKNLESDLERYLKSIVKPISLSKFEEYNHQFEMFTTCADSVYKDKGENALKEYLQEKGPPCPCAIVFLCCVRWVLPAPGEYS